MITQRNIIFFSLVVLAVLYQYWTGDFIPFFFVIGKVVASGTNWTDGARLNSFVVPTGIAKVEISGTVDWDDIYNDPALKEIYIFKRTDTETTVGQVSGGGFYDAYITLVVGDGSTTTTLNINNAQIRFWGRLGCEFSSNDLVTVNIGDKSTNSRVNGVTIIKNSWCGNQWRMDLGTWNLYNTTIYECDYTIDPTYLMDDTADVSTMTKYFGFGRDANFLVKNGTWEDVKFDRMGRYRASNTVSNALLTTASPVIAKDVNSFDNFYNYQGGKMLNKGWIVEASAYGMYASGNGQQTDNGEDIIFQDFEVIDATTAEAYIGHMINVHWVNPKVTGGTASNTNFTVSLYAPFIYGGASFTRIFRMWFPVSVTVLDSSTGNPISGATVRIYKDNATSTLASTFDPDDTTVSVGSWSFTTDANGKVSDKQLLYATWTPAGSQGAGDEVATLSGHVTAGRLTVDADHPYKLSVQASGYKTYEQAFDTGEEKNLTIGLGSTATNNPVILMTT